MNHYFEMLHNFAPLKLLISPIHSVAGYKQRFSAKWARSKNGKSALFDRGQIKTSALVFLYVTLFTNENIKILLSVQSWRI